VILYKAQDVKSKVYCSEYMEICSNYVCVTSVLAYWVPRLQLHYSNVFTKNQIFKMTRMKKKQIAAFPKKQILQLALKDAEKLHNLLMLNGFVMHWNLFNYYQPVCFAFIYLTIFNITVQCNTEMHKNWIFVIFLCQLAFSCILFRSTVLSSWFPSQQHVHVKLVNKLPHTHTHTPHYRDHQGEPVPEENFWTLWCKGR